MLRSGRTQLLPQLAILGTATVAILGLRMEVPQSSDPPYCWHDRFVVSSEWHCGGDTSSFAYPSPAPSFRNVSNLRPFADEDTLIIAVGTAPPGGRGATGSAITEIKIPLQPKTDAVFLSRFAMDSMLVPYFKDKGYASVATLVDNHVKQAWPDLRPERMLLVCQRMQPLPAWHCTDSVGTRRLVPGLVRNIYISRRRSNGEWRRTSIGRGADAIFWSREAAEGILLPYYQRKSRNLADSIARKWTPRRPR